MVSSQFVKTCTGLLALYFVGLIFMVTGFATDNWVDGSGFNSGLFRSCADGFGCTKNDISLYEGWMNAVLAFTILGLIMTVVGGTTYMYVPVSGGFQIAGGLCTIIGVGIFGGYQASENPLWEADFLGFSFALSTVGGLCVLANGITLLALMAEEGTTMEMILPTADKIGTA